MTEKQFEIFLYNCQTMASKLHFNNEDGIVRFLNGKPLNEQTFLEAISSNANLLKALNSGVCFSMSSWVFELLFSMGLNDSYYFMESGNSNGYNFVILYNIYGEYKICDLAAQVCKNEKVIANIVQASILRNSHPELYSLEKIQEMCDNLSSQEFLVMDIEDYIKEYPLATCKVLLHHGHEEDPYEKVPRQDLKAFLERELSVEK